MPDISGWVPTSIWLRSLLIVVITVVLGRALGQTSRKYGARLAARTDSYSDDYFVSVLGYTVEWMAYGVGLATLLSTLNINITPLVTGAGFFGIVIGLAAREYIANVLGGLIIIADRPLDVGDRVQLPKLLGDYYGSWGDVISIGLRSTKILSVDGVVLTVPNGVLMNDVVINYNHQLSPNLRARVQIGVDPEPKNTKAALALVREIVESHPKVLRVPRPPQVILRDLRQYEALIEARFFIDEPVELRPVRSDVFERFIEEAAARKIRLSAQVHQVYLRGNDEDGREVPDVNRRLSGTENGGSAGNVEERDAGVR